MSTKVHHAQRDERIVPDGRRVTLTIWTDGGEQVPAVLHLPPAGVPPAGVPPAGVPPAPAALLLHGYTSRKEQMADGVGRVLLRHGIASLAIDLPLHGERSGSLDAAALRSPIELARVWSRAQDDARLALGYLSARPEVDRERLALVGYSMGSFLGVLVAAKAAHVRAVVLAAGGDLPDGTPFARLVRTVADPIRAVRALAGRPLLMVHGRTDRTVTAAQAQRLFDAAGEPKELRWWDAGHYLPTAAIDEAAVWLGDRLGAGARSERSA